MNVNNCISEAKRVMSFDGDMLVVRIGEISKKHFNNITLSESEKFIIGLRYSEFLAEGTSDLDYYQASIKQQACLRKLEIDQLWLIERCKAVCGLY